MKQESVASALGLGDAQVLGLPESPKKRFDLKKLVGRHTDGTR
jgi:hypothetical protein